jgi:hypothetical protein
MKKLILKWLLGDKYENFMHEIDPNTNQHKSDNQKHQALIVGIMNEFNFEKVHDVMEYLNWTWSIPGSMNESEIPSLERIKYRAESMLKEVCMRAYDQENQYTIGTGGFEVTAFYKDGNITDLELKFVLAQWDENIEHHL